MIIRRGIKFYDLEELSKLSGISYKAVHIKLKRRNIKADFKIDRKSYFHESAVKILKEKLKNYKTIYEKIYITQTFFIKESKLNYTKLEDLPQWQNLEK
jgi:hypothetical protein